ncbi:protein-tyrosine phosphatase family protein [uncultured Microbacterium sp.]|uniref:protein-tyrosine phosphatase family protein n=1 Tax=uncultured Microbacterium sp. TaxID=191216 RepID=UPI00344E40C9
MRVKLFGEDDGVESWSPAQRGVVVLPSGRAVRGRALSDGAVGDGDAPSFGLYLTSHPHQERWESRWLMWPDFRIPRFPSDAIAALRDAYDRSLTERVEIACAGGRGRTGTAIAILARYDGVPAEAAVAWVRAAYRRGAVETPWQRRFVREAPLARLP